jgi:hypothetical protein
MMPLSPDFTFSQQSLQTFLDCRRRFQLRYLRRLAWPAVQSEPMLEQERRMQLGKDFHTMAQQLLLGLPVERITEMARDPELFEWWSAFLDAAPYDLPGRTHPEVALTAPLADWKLTAKYDLIVVPTDEKVVIVDWKTSIHRSSPARLLEWMQSRVYPYLLAKAGWGLNAGEPIHPVRIEMIYWYPAFPDTPISFPYSQSRFDEDHALLEALVRAINGLGETDFPVVADERACRFCQYRSYCDRGIEAGSLADRQDDPDDEIDDLLDLDFEQIAEIEY